MKFTIEANQLKQVLSRAVSVCEKRGTIPILQNVLIEVAGDKAKFTATDLDIQVTESVNVEVLQEGAITVSAAMLSALSGKFDNGPLVSMQLKDGYLHINHGKSKNKLLTLPPEDFPRLASSEFNTTFPIPSETLKSAIDRTIWAASSETTRFYLCGIALQRHEGRATFIATDGHRLSRFVADDAPPFDDVIIPTKTATQWSKALNDTIEDVEVSISPTKTRIKSGDIEVLSKIVDGTYPAWQRVIPVDHPNKVVAKSVELSKAIDRVATVATERTKAVKLTIANNEATVTVIDPNNGTGTDVVDVEQYGDDVEIGINSKYGLAALAQADKGDVTIQYKGGMDQIVVTYEKEPTLLCVVMPQRI